jgi:dihydrofolate synthase / folylpolyglutamate synthase
MTFDEAMHFWFGRINYEQKAPRPGDFTLVRVRLLLERLGDPQRRYRIFHLAGSKGKGSTSAMLAAVLRAQGYRTGLFTSPHLVDVEERFQVDGEPISRVELTARMDEIRSAAEGLCGSDGRPLSETITFFEISTALGLLHFAYRRVEWAVLEVGLGGRLDATSVCMPETSLITSISFDHVEMLGDTLAKIAGEKAGIIKPERPVISGVVQPEAADVIARRCRDVGAPLRVLGRDFRFKYEPARIESHRQGHVTVETWRGRYPGLTLALIGEHQAANAAVAVAALETARERGLAVTDRSIAAGLAGVTWPARLEVVGNAPLVVLDCAHNVASAEALRDALLTSFRVSGDRVLLFGISRDKDAAGMLAVLQPIFRHIVLTRFEKNPRSVPPEQLRAMLTVDQEVHLVDHPLEALATARRFAQADDLLCITGSVFLAGDLRPHLVDAVRDR